MKKALGELKYLAYFLWRFYIWEISQMKGFQSLSQVEYGTIIEANDSNNFVLKNQPLTFVFQFSGVKMKLFWQIIWNDETESRLHIIMSYYISKFKWESYRKTALNAWQWSALFGRQIVGCTAKIKWYSFQIRWPPASI